MKKRDFILILLALALFCGIWIWLTPASHKSVPAVTLLVATNSPGTSTNELIFRLENHEPRAFFLSELFVDVKTPNGWLQVNQLTPADSRVVAPGGSKDLPVLVPIGDGPWRLRIAYGPQVGGASLFLAKVAFAIHDRRMPGNGFGVFAGSNSLCSAAMNR
jgi:hypothetical protein